MAYNKTEHLRRNIEAIRTAFALEREQRAATPEERDVLRAYSGFGAIKEVLEPLPHKKGTALTPLIEELHAVLKENTGSEREYKRYLDGLKASVLTAFYTPEPVTDAIARMLYNAGAVPVRALEPSAGTGAFVEYLRRYNEEAEITCFEKDPMTGLILSRLYPDDTVRVQGLETIEPAYEGHFDLITSNIPFGDVSLFDPAFSNSRDPVRRQGAWAIHNYFFMKSVDLVRDGGLVAFITSQGMADAERNRPVREWLMERCDLIAAVRLPNNLFTDHAGTEVGSDLIVLQKNSAARPLSERQRDFIETRTLSNGITVNNSFQSLDRVVQTSARVGTNPYGKPAMEFTHAGGVEGIARALADMLAEDMERHFNRELYESHALKIAPHQYREQQTETVSPRQAHNGIGQVRNTELSGQTVLRQHGNEEIAQENLATERGGIGREQKNRIIRPNSQAADTTGCTVHGAAFGNYGRYIRRRAAVPSRSRSVLAGHRRPLVSGRGRGEHPDGRGPPCRKAAGGTFIRANDALSGRSGFAAPVPTNRRIPAAGNLRSSSRNSSARRPAPSRRGTAGSAFRPAAESGTVSGRPDAGTRTFR